MPLTATSDLMSDAAAKGRGIGAFNVVHMETAEGLVAAANQTGLPIILQISENCVLFHGRLEPIALATLALAKAADAPVAVHLDHAKDEQLIRRAVELGFGSVMFDGSCLEYEENVATTRRVVDFAHTHSVYVEAELGKIGGKDGVHSPSARTDPAEAADFVQQTGVDALAVAVGSSHAMMSREALLDLNLIEQLRTTLTVPLVLHGSSGVSDKEIVRAINAGMTKINISTHLNRYFTEAIRGYLENNTSVADSRKYIGVGRDALAAEAARIITEFAKAQHQESR